MIAYALPDIAGGPGNGNPMDGIVNVQDFLKLISVWGPCPPGECCLGDINRDRVVDVQDYLLLLGHWGLHPKDFERCHPAPA